MALTSSLISSLKLSIPVAVTGAGVVAGAGAGVGVGVGVGAGIGLRCGAGAGLGVGASDGVSLQPTANKDTSTKIINTVKYFFIIFIPLYLLGENFCAS